WSKDEDCLLVSAIRRYGKSDWDSISKEVGSRNKVQCKNRWLYTLTYNPRRGQWSSTEDELLIKGVKTHCRNWTLIAKEIKGRTNEQVRLRWRKLSSPESTWMSKPWTAQEDWRLIHGVYNYGLDWMNVSRCVEGRKVDECLRRW
ncbi:Homeodomain-like protein, partial [Paraphysoderma sedebokerense]